MVIRKAYFLVLALITTLSLEASTEHTYQSILDGRIPYLVVKSDKDGGSRRDPGIYFGDADGHWQPAIRGEVLAGETSQGILGEFQITRSTGKYEALAVVDGRIVIFNTLSRKDERDSFSVIGEGAHAPVDIFTEHPFQLEKIKRLQDLNMVLMEESPEGQGVLFSLRQKNPFGSGITFALFLKRPIAGDSSSSPQLISEPRIVDYRFRDFSGLKRLINIEHSKSGVFSEHVIASYAKERGSEPPALRLWRAGLRRQLTDLASSAVGSIRKPSSIPWLDLLDQKIKLEDPPTKELVVGGTKLVQVYDPRLRKDTLCPFDFKERQGRQSVLLNGSVDYDDQNNTYLVYGVQKPNDSAALLSVHEELIFVVGNGNALATSHVGLYRPPKFLYSDLSFAFEKVGKQAGNEETYVVLVSQKTPSPTTNVWLISKVGSSLSIKSSFAVFGHFLTQPELAARISTAVMGKVLFDNVTPPQGSLEAYRKSARPTYPFIDLTSFSGGGGPLAQVYVKPVESVRFNAYLAYRVFDQTGATENKTGLAFIDSQGQETDVYRGSLLRKGDLAQEAAHLGVGDFVLASNVKTQPGVFGQVTAVAMDPNHKAGTQGFELVFVAHRASATGTSFSPILQRFEAMFPFSQLKFVQILSGKNKSRDRIVALVGFGPSSDPEAPETYREGGLIAYTFRLTPVGSNADKVELNVQDAGYRKLGASEISARELTSRLGIDQDGRYYWVSKPEILRDDARFKVVDLSTGREVFPNNKASKGLKIVFGEDARAQGLQLEEEHETARVENPWHVYARMDMQRLISFSFDEKGKKKIEAERKLYPRLEETLDALADSAKSPQHQVILVAEEQKEVMKELILHACTQRDHGTFRFENQRLRLAIFDPAHATQRDVLQNLLDLQDTKARERSLLIVDAKDLDSNARPGAGDEDEEQLRGLVETKEISGASDLPHILDLFSREGRVGSHKDFGDPFSSEARMSQLILATPAEWEKLKHADEERGFNLESRFSANSEFLHSNWRVWPTETQKSKPEIQRMLLQPSSPMDYEVFPETLTLLEELADPSKPARHVMLIVPDEQKALIEKIVFRTYGAKRGPRQDDRHWCQTNPHLKVFSFDRADSSQRTVMVNYKAMQRLGSEDRSVLVGDLEMVSVADRPSVFDDGKGFLIQDPVQVSQGADGFSDDLAPGKAVPPHMLWFIASEGARLSPREFESQRSAPRRISTLLIGTEEDLEIIEDETGLERRFGLLEHFEITRLSPPSDRAKKNLVGQVLRRPEFQALNIRYEIEAGAGRNAEDPQAQLVAYLVNRTELLARQFQMESTTAFMRVLNALSINLAEDQIFRRSKVFDKSFIERLLTHVFNIPLNLQSLAPDDPLVMLSDKRKTAFALQNAGYLGPLDLKYDFIDALLAQTRAGELGRAVPSSVIIFGDTSTGKTFLVEKLFEVLGIRIYDRLMPNDEFARGLIVKVGEIDPDKLEEEVAHWERFLSLPLGYRGYIFFDDVHKARDEKVLQAVIGFQNRLFEAKDGLIHINVRRGRDLEPREIPVRNITLLQSINPPQDLEKRRRFAQTNSDVDMIVAALSRPKMELERSYVARWSKVLNVSRFPVEAKSPALMANLRVSARHDFNLNNRLTLVDPAAVRTVTDRFPNANAREFLATAANHLLQLSGDQLKSEKIVVIVPSDRLDEKEAQAKLRGGDQESPVYNIPSFEASGTASAMIGQFISERMIALPVNEASLDGRLIMLSFMVDATRTFFYESFVEAIIQDTDLIEDPVKRRSLLGPLLNALTANLHEHPSMPLSVLGLDPADFGVRNATARGDFNQAVRRTEWSPQINQKFFPIQFADEFAIDHDVRRLIEPGFHTTKEKSRAHLLAEISSRATRIQRQLLGSLLRLPNLDTLPTSENWLSGMQENDGEEQIRDIGRQTLHLFRDFWERLYDESYRETKQPGEFESMTPYDAARLFMIALDKSMVKLPWAALQRFVMDGLIRVTGDLDYGQRPAVQHYFFDSKTSVLKPSTLDYVFQMASSSEAYRGWTEDLRKTNAADFRARCTRLLVQVAQ